MEWLDGMGCWNGWNEDGADEWMDGWMDGWVVQPTTTKAQEKKRSQASPDSPALSSPSFVGLAGKAIDSLYYFMSLVPSLRNRSFAVDPIDPTGQKPKPKAKSSSIILLCKLSVFLPCQPVSVSPKSRPRRRMPTTDSSKRFFDGLRLCGGVAWHKPLSIIDRIDRLRGGAALEAASFGRCRTRIACGLDWIGLDGMPPSSATVGGSRRGGRRGGGRGDGVTSQQQAASSQQQPAMVVPST